MHIASPGMVATELLLGGERDQRAARIINILAEEAEVVAAWMVPRMRGIRGNGKYFKCALCSHRERLPSGQRFAWKWGNISGALSALTSRACREDSDLHENRGTLQGYSCVCRKGLCAGSVMPGTHAS